MNDREFTVKLKTLPVHFVGRQKQIEILFPRLVGPSVQSIMKRLRDFEKILAAGDDVPTRPKSEFLNQRNQAIQDLRHSAAHRCGIDHLDRASGKLRGERTQLVKFASSQQRNVGVQAHQMSLRLCKSHAASSRSINV